ncbi:YrhK family protein [Martelella mediterranea]|uniref:YrhK family protein n=1 Tax=Martelella mediterranea TaxID=293089 RepID=UPI003AF3FBC6|nr:YrhK family protein [Martelella mediterranea]
MHLSLGLLGNIGFFVGSIFFLPSLEQYKTLGVWLFIVGSFFMLIGALGRLLVDVTDKT